MEIKAYLKTPSGTEGTNNGIIRTRQRKERNGSQRYEISDKQWEQIKEMFSKASTGKPPKDNRLMFNAILWLARSGAAWEDIPERYGPHQTVYSRFCKWIDDGTLLHIFQALNEDADFENLSIDSTSVKANLQSAGAKKRL